MRRLQDELQFLLEAHQLVSVFLKDNFSISYEKNKPMSILDGQLLEITNRIASNKKNLETIIKQLDKTAVVVKEPAISDDNQD